MNYLLFAVCCSCNIDPDFDIAELKLPPCYGESGEQLAEKNLTCVKLFCSELFGGIYTSAVCHL